MRREPLMITTESLKKRETEGDRSMFEDVYETLGRLVHMFLDWIEVTLPAMMLAVFGATVRAINEHSGRWLWHEYFAGIALAMFVGYAVDCTLSSLGLPMRARSLAIAVSGYLSSEVMQALERVYEKKIIFIIGGGPDEKSNSKETNGKLPRK